MKCIDCGTNQYVNVYNEQIELCLDCINKRETQPLMEVDQPKPLPAALHRHLTLNENKQRMLQDRIDAEIDWAILVDQSSPPPKYTSSYKVLREVDEIQAMRSRMFMPRGRMIGTKKGGYGLDDLVREMQQYNSTVFGPKKKKRGFFRR